MLTVQRQVYIDLLKYDSLKAYVALLEKSNATLNEEVVSLYNTIDLKTRQHQKLEERLKLTEQDQQFDKRTIELLKKQARQSRVWVAIGKGTVKIALPVGLASLAFYSIVK